jgi:hypothetical protein
MSRNFKKYAGVFAKRYGKFFPHSFKKPYSYTLGRIFFVKLPNFSRKVPISAL